MTACLDRMHRDKVNWIHCFPRVIIIQGPYSDPIIFLPSRCYNVAGWRLDQTKGDHGTVRWSLNCQLMCHASAGRTCPGGWRRGSGALPKGFSVGSPALCTYYGESQSVVGKHNLEIMKDN